VAPSSIWILDTHGGDPVRVTDGTAMDMAPQWLPDGRHLLFVSDRDGTRGIYSIEVGRNGPRGPPRAVAGASGNPHSISVSADGKRLAWADFDVVQNIWSVPIPESGSVSIRDAVPVTTGNQVIESHDVSPDGEWIVFDSNIRGAFAIYRQRLAGGSPELLPGVDGDAFEPEWSPDGSEVAFYAALTVGGQGEIFVVSADGSTPPEQITRFPGVENQPDWSPDGLAIAYSSQGPQGTDLLKIWMVTRDSAGGRWSEPALLTDFYCIMPAWAPDGESLVCQTRDESVRVSRSGDVITHYGRPAGLEYQGPGGFDFSRDSSKIYFHAVQEDGSHGLWWLPAEGGEPARVVAFDDPARYAPGNYSLGPDRMYVTIAEYESDIWVMDLVW
jgi:Tol biopolymer transport system component